MTLGPAQTAVPEEKRFLDQSTNFGKNKSMNIRALSRQGFFDEWIQIFFNVFDKQIYGDMYSIRIPVGIQLRCGITLGLLGGISMPPLEN